MNIFIPEIKLASEYNGVEILNECQKFIIRIIQKDTNASYIVSGWYSYAYLALPSVLSVIKYKPHLMEKITSLILLSSGIDLTLDVNNFSPYKKQQEQDIFVAGSRVLMSLASLYAQETNYDDLNPLIKYKKELNNLPRVDVVSGEYNVLLGDSIYLNYLLNRQISVCNLHLLQGQTHNIIIIIKIMFVRVYSDTNVFRVSERDGCLNFLRALASICLIRSLVTSNCFPTSSRV